MFQEIHNYLHRVTPKRPPVLSEMEEYAKDNGFPIVGPLVGRLLYQMALLTDARRILELGSGYGYSAFWFSLAIGENGHIIMTDTNESNRERALDCFKRAGLKSRFDFRVDDALDVMEREDGPFDIIFNDIDKEGYPHTIDPVAVRLRPGGLFITDNLIWSGRVCGKERDATTEAIVEFTHRLYKDARFFTTIMPVRDGVAVAIRR